jgi:asparagine synthetase B (glutamine-hydrolysing)
LGSPEKNGIIYTAKDFALQQPNGYEVINTLKDFSGSFGIIYLRGDSSHLFLVRDKFGGMPVYCAFDNYELEGVSTFSRDLLMVTKSVGINYDFLARYAVCRYDDVAGRDESPLTKLIKIPPATVLDTRSANPLSRYWDFMSIQNEYNYSNFEDVSKEINQQLINSSKSIYEKEGSNLSLALSGGMDSSILASIYAEIGVKLHTLTAYYGDGLRFDESATAKKLSYALGHDWSPVEIHPQSFCDSLKNAYERHSFPLATSSTLGYDFIYQNSSYLGFNKLIVGTKSDRLFSGHYPHYLYNLADLFESDQELFSNELNSWVTLHSTPEFQKSTKTFIEFLDVDINNCARGKIIPRAKLLGANYLRNERVYAILKSSKDIEFYCKSYLQSYTAYETWYYELHSIEARNSWNYQDGLSVYDPYGNESLFEYCWHMPAHYKIQNGINKKILRHIAKINYPKIDSPLQKLGFTVPFNNWCTRDEFKEFIMTVIVDGIKDSPLNLYINLSKIKEDYQKGININSMLLWQVVNALHWEKSMLRYL